MCSSIRFVLSSPLSMNQSMASYTKRDQVFWRIFSRVAAKLFVMHYKIGHCTASLAFPSIPSEHFIAKVRV